MNFAPDIDTTDVSPEFTEPVPSLEAAYSGKRVPELADLIWFQFEQTVFPFEGGQQILKLTKPLELKMNSEGTLFTVKDWGIELDALWDIPREVVRKFLYLFSKAEKNCLSEQEQAEWLAVSDYLDFKQYTIDRSPPRYMEGTLCSQSNKVIVEWHDGKRETLKTEVAKSLDMIDPGEHFSAFVKLGANDTAMQIERVSMRPTVDEENWESWPEKA